MGEQGRSQGEKEKAKKHKEKIIEEAKQKDCATKQSDQNRAVGEENVLWLI